jgi:glucose/arabinose dehydrogenase
VVILVGREASSSSIARLFTLPPLALAYTPAVLSVTSPEPTAGFISHTLDVPDSMRLPPFDVDRQLTIPIGFSLEVYARVDGARFLAVAPNNDLLVSQPNAGRVLLIRPASDGDPIVVEFVTDLRRPHDIVFHSIDGVTYVYIAETHQINRFVYWEGDLTAHDREIVVRDLPDSSSPELGGSYGHELKNIALDENHQLYVSIASSCNACLSDVVSEPRRGAVYRYSADGSNPQLFAEGLRNAEGLAVLPGTNDLWAVVNNRDDISYPFDDGSGFYGSVVPWYVDDHPAEAFTRVREGGNYGWPFCNPNPDTASGYDNMPFDVDYEINGWGEVDCEWMDRITKGIQAHSAPLGLTWLQNTNVPASYRAGAIIALHGSWNRQAATGYKVIYFPFNAETWIPEGQVDVVTGWLNEDTGEIWGRPVDVVADVEGHLLISDDYSGTIYKMSEIPADCCHSIGTPVP